MKMKGQFIFEFLISGLVFFAVVLFTINFLTSNVAEFKNQYYIDQLQMMSVRAAELLTSENSDASLSSGWPVFSKAEIDGFDTDCMDPAKYDNIVRKLGLTEATVFGVRRHDANIVISYADGTEIGSCGPGIPEYVSKSEVKRYGLLDSDGRIIEMSVVVW